MSFPFKSQISCTYDEIKSLLFRVLTLGTTSGTLPNPIRCNARVSSFITTFKSVTFPLIIHYVKSVYNVISAKRDVFSPPNKVVNTLAPTSRVLLCRGHRMARPSIDRNRSHCPVAGRLLGTATIMTINNNNDDNNYNDNKPGSTVYITATVIRPLYVLSRRPCQTQQKPLIAPAPWTTLCHRRHRLFASVPANRRRPATCPTTTAVLSTLPANRPNTILRYDKDPPPSISLPPPPRPEAAVHIYEINII